MQRPHRFPVSDHWGKLVCENCDMASFNASFLNGIWITCAVPLLMRVAKAEGQYPERTSDF